jgi:hypothetical protein
MKKSTRETLFFIIVFLLFYLAVKLQHYWLHKTQMNKDVATFIVGGLFTLCLVSIFFLANLQTKEDFWDVSDYAKCKGGAYFWQGDSPTSKMCRELAETPEGRIGISSYNCPTGYVGQPGLPFYYSPLSGDKWTNERCENIPNCKGVDVGLCSLEKQVE